MSESSLPVSRPARPLAWAALVLFAVGVAIGAAWLGASAPRADQRAAATAKEVLALFDTGRYYDGKTFEMAGRAGQMSGGSKEEWTDFLPLFEFDPDGPTAFCGCPATFAFRVFDPDGQIREFDLIHNRALRCGTDLRVLPLTRASAEAVSNYLNAHGYIVGPPQWDQP